MNERVIKEHLLAALKAAYVSDFKIEEIRSEFLVGHRDLGLTELMLDSLGLMEFCIFLEVNGLATYAPEEVLGFKTLGELAQAILRSKS